jgi:hypothetical protein
MAAVTLHRTNDRKHLGVEIRVERLEEDADTHDAIFEAIDKRMATLNARLTGMLISLVVASVMLAVNLAVK